METLRPAIEAAFERRHEITPATADAKLIEAVETVMDHLDSGRLRVASPGADADAPWQVNEWLKKAVLLSFRLRDNVLTEDSTTRYFDKVPLKYAQYNADRFRRERVRVVPQALVRRGAYVAPDVVLMPSYVNLGAYIGEGSMIDTWATVGSCAQIGRNVHLSGGAGIGGVLEPVQASPTIIEDECFIGARSEVVEGVRVRRGAVIAMGVFLGASTRIYDRERDEVIYGEVPPGAVVVPGTLPSADGRYALNCAIIVKRVDEKTRAKVGLNELLRTV